MSLSVSNQPSESKIAFETDSLFSNADSWTIKKGSKSGGVITLNKGGTAKLTKNIDDNLICNYLKLVCNVTCNDHTISSENYHNVSIACKIKFEDNDGNESTEMYSYFPTYDFETIHKNDYDTFSTPNSKIKKMEITVTNNEDIPIQITSSGMYTSKVINEEAIKDYFNSPDGQDAFNEAFSDDIKQIVYESGVIFPIYETMAGIPSDAPDGFACIVLNA